MNIGKLDRRVDIQSVSYADDDYGDSQTASWSNYATSVPAAIMFPNAGNQERLELVQTVAVDDPVFRIRWDSSIVPKDYRIVYNSKNYYVTGRTEIGRQEGMDLSTEQRDNE